MAFHVVIPARYQSSRLPGKPLKDIAGHSMIERVYRQAELSGAASVAIATDDQRIVDHVNLFGGQVVMTSSSHESGTDRIYEACSKMKLTDNDVIVNVQGDEPFIPPEVIRQTAELLESPDSKMATVCVPIVTEEQVHDPNTVKVVISHNNKAIYFSRSPIPFNRDSAVFSKINYYRHIGIYGFKYHFLAAFSQLPPSNLEHIEKLEQLRVLESGHSIEIDVAIKTPPAGVDTADDLQAACEYARGLTIK